MDHHSPLEQLALMWMNTIIKDLSELAANHPSAAASILEKSAEPLEDAGISVNPLFHAISAGYELEASKHPHGSAAARYYEKMAQSYETRAEQRPLK